MSWHCYQLTFKIVSPLHIGFHKVMHLYRTRYYVYGKLLWGAVTAKLTKLLESDYQVVGAFLREAMRFGYFYISAQNEIYLPKYTEEGLKFHTLTISNFEKKFIYSMASTAIEPNSLTAEEGMLYEVEFINPYTLDDSKEVYLKGLIWIKEFNGKGVQLKKTNTNEWLFKFNDKEINFVKEVINRLQIGGERRCGFGVIEHHKECSMIEKDHDMIFPGRWEEVDGEVFITLQEGDPIWAHALCSSDLKIKGDIEPLVGREWDESRKGTGRKLTSAGLYWCIGSQVLGQTKFKIKDYGTWEAT